MVAKYNKIFYEIYLNENFIQTEEATHYDIETVVKAGRFLAI